MFTVCIMEHWNLNLPHAIISELLWIKIASNITAKQKTYLYIQPCYQKHAALSKMFLQIHTQQILSFPIICGKMSLISGPFYPDLIIPPRPPKHTENLSRLQWLRITLLKSNKSLLSRSGFYFNIDRKFGWNKVFLHLRVNMIFGFSIWLCFNIWGWKYLHICGRSNCYNWGWFLQMRLTFLHLWLIFLHLLLVFRKWKIFTFEVVTNLHPRAKAYLMSSKFLT